MNKTFEETINFLKKNFSDFFVFYEPKNAAGGDFYWVKQILAPLLQALDKQFSNQNSILNYPNPYNSSLIIRKGGIVEEFKPNHPTELQKGDSFYLFSNGFSNQPGGLDNENFGNRNFLSLLVAISEKPMKEQQILLEQTLDMWQGDLEQVDDICIVGVRV